MSSEEVGTDSDAISAGIEGMSFLQFSKKEVGASAVCACNAFVVKGTSHLACDGGSTLTEVDAVDGDGSDLSESATGRMEVKMGVLMTDFGGHSRLSLVSSLAESPVIWETTLELRDGEPAEMDSRLFWVSKRPMRLATLRCGRSSGSGLFKWMNDATCYDKSTRTLCLIVKSESWE